MSFADTMNGYRHFADMNSFIDYFIMNEVTRNVDGLRLSTYLYKNKNTNGGKLIADQGGIITWHGGTPTICGGYMDTGWAYKFGRECPDDGYQVPFWWRKLLTDTTYADALKCRWSELRSGPLSNTHIFQYIDSTATYLNVAKDRHFTVWPILGVYTWPNPSPLAADYAGEITNMKTWITNRMAWLDTNMPGTCYVIPDTTISVGNFATAKNTVNIYPNPYANELNVDFVAQTAGKVLAELYSAIVSKSVEFGNQLYWRQEPCSDRAGQ